MNEEIVKKFYEAYENLHCARMGDTMAEIYEMEAKLAEVRATYPDAPEEAEAIERYNNYIRTL